MVFGLVEGLYDVSTTKKTRRYIAAIAAVLSHTFFGLITVYFLKHFESPLMAVVYAILIHFLFNFTVTILEADCNRD